MEPCIDPAIEVQCAGRIHRMGQTKEVLVQRFCFCNSLEERVVNLHTEVEQNGRKLTAVRGKTTMHFFPDVVFDLLGMGKHWFGSPFGLPSNQVFFMDYSGLNTNDAADRNVCRFCKETFPPGQFRIKLRCMKNR